MFPVPADTGVGVGRSLKEKENKEPEQSGKGKRIMETKEITAMFKRAAKFGIDADTVQALIDDGKGGVSFPSLSSPHKPSACMVLETKKPDMPEARCCTYSWRIENGCP